MNSSKSRKLEIKSGIKIILISIVLIAIDQISKLIVSSNLKGRDPVTVIDGVFQFYYYENPFAAFNFGKQFSGAFLILVLILTTAFCAFLIYISFRIPSEKKYRIIRLVVILLLAGAAGNFIDRLFHHYVIDFLYFVLINFPIFNIADIYVVTGAIVFICSVLFRGSLYDELFPGKKKKKEAEEKISDDEKPE